jgi:polysaccharide chain length determinant protein (PEP-CTERM system associated)
MDNEAASGSPFETARSIWERRKWPAIAVFAAAFSAAISLVIFLPNIYQGTATVLVQREQISEAFVKSAVTAEIQTRLQTISEQILSRARLKELINLFNLYPNERQQLQMEEVVDKMKRDIRLEVKNVEETSGHRAPVAFTLSYRGRDPQTTATVTNTLASFFVEANWKDRGRQATETAGFFKVQLDELKKRLEEQESRLGEYKGRFPDEFSQRSSLASMEQLNSQLRLNMDRLGRAMERRENIVKQLGDALPNGYGGAPGSKPERLKKLKDELRDLGTQYTDAYPDVARLKSEIAALEREPEATPDGAAKVNAEKDPAVKTLRQSLKETDGEINGLKSEEKRLQQATSVYQRKLESVPKEGKQATELMRDYETTKELYASLLKRYADAQYAENLEASQKGERFTILDSAVPPRSPAAPNRLLLSLIGLVLSLGLGAVAMVLAEQADTTFHSVNDLRAFTKIPVLVSIPSIVTPADVEKRRQRMGLATVAAMAGLVLIVALSYFIAHGNEGIVKLLSGRAPAATSTTPGT